MARARLRAFLCVALALAGLAGALHAAPSFPALTGRIVDQAEVLEASVEARLNTKLADLENKTSTQLVVVTLRSLQGYDIADFGYQLGRHWGIGQKGTNNGALLIVAPTDRKVRIEVGYGLEGTLTDAVSRLIIDNAILPRFRTGDFVGGIERGVDDVIQVLSGDAEDFKQRAAERSRPSGSEGLGTTVFVVLFLAFWLFIMLRSWRRELFGARRRRRGGWWPPVAGAGSAGSSGGGWSSGSSGGGWSSGDSGGGFSGGGGDFGGGGSSGSW